MRKVIEVGGGKLTMGTDCKLYIEDDEGNRAALWLSQDDLEAIAKYFQTFAALSELEDER